MACKLPNFTVLSEIFVLKFEPLITTVEPIPPDTGLKPLITGGGVAGVVTVKLAAELAVSIFTVTEIG